jgi:RND family efflux transporter MFP subunit
MRVRHLRRHYQGFWRQFQRLTPTVLALALLLLMMRAGNAQAATPIAWTPAEPESAYQATRVYAGRTRAARAAELGFKQPGELREVLVKEGSVVVAGQSLAQLNTDTLEAALRQSEAEEALGAANVQALEAETELAKATEARFRSLHANNHVSAQSFDEARLTLATRQAQLAVGRAGLDRARAARAAARIAVDEASLQAPFAGIIQSRYRDEGSQLAAGEPLLRLVEDTAREAHIGIPETIAATLQATTTHQIVWNGARFPARLRAILPEVDNSTRSLRAIFLLDDTRIPIGAVVELALLQSVSASGYWLPMTALTEADRGLWSIFVVNDDNVLERRLVEIIHTESSRAFVRGTLTPGDRVVQTGVQRLVAGQQVSPALASADATANTSGAY